MHKKIIAKRPSLWWRYRDDVFDLWQQGLPALETFTQYINSLYPRNVIYLASCKKCQLQYIGSTTTEFKVRFRNHKSSMLTNKKTCEVAVHFNSAPHSLQDFEFQCIDQIAHANSRTLLENTLITKEAYWSAQLFTLSPYGLNKRQEFHSKNRIHYNQDPN